VSDDLDTPEILAGEYVLGLLRGEECARFEQRLSREPEFAGHVAAWERRLAPLASGRPPTAPSPRVWRKIAARISRRPPSRELRFWRLAAVAAGIAVILLGSLLATQLEDSPPVRIALLADDQAHPVLFVSTEQRGGPVQVKLLRQPQVPKDRSLELWLLPLAGGAPQSLGILSSEGQTTLRLSPEQLRALAEAAGLAVSVEPPGGSSTGAPTGPVVFSGSIETSL
jgi:anti-sigma-K factor RskA